MWAYEQKLKTFPLKSLWVWFTSSIVLSVQKECVAQRWQEGAPQCRIEYCLALMHWVSRKYSNTLAFLGYKESMATMAMEIFVENEAEILISCQISMCSSRYQVSLQLSETIWLLLIKALWAEVTSGPKHSRTNTSPSSISFSALMTLQVTYWVGNMVRWWNLCYTGSPSYILEQSSKLTQDGCQVLRELRMILK